MSAKLAKKDEFNGIRYSSLKELLTYFDTSFDALVASDKFSDLDADDRISRVDAYRGLRRAIIEVKKTVAK